MTLAFPSDAGLMTTVERAKAYLVECKDLDQVKDYRDKAEAMRVYQRSRGGGIELQNVGAEIKLLAERRLGELTRALPKARGGRPRETLDSVSRVSKAEVLAEGEVELRQASRWEALAALPQEAFDNYLATMKAKGEEITTAGALRSTAVSSGEDYDGDEWYTPAFVLDRVRLVFGEIDVDPASNPHAQKTVRARSWFSKEEDGLSHEWTGKVFCNPPYSMPLIGQFTRKLTDEIAAGRTTEAIYLVNNCTDASWCHALLRVCACFCLTTGRIGFLSKTGQKFATRQGQIIFYFGENVDAFKDAFGSIGFIGGAL